MKRYIIILVVFCMLLSACEDEYIAKLDQSDAMLEIEALLTNNESVNYVKLTKTVNFYAKENQKRVAGAKVIINDKSGNSYTLSESSLGYFRPDFGAVPGESYRITVEVGGETYESDYELMSPVPAVDTILVKPDTTISYIYGEDGVPLAMAITGMTVYAGFSEDPVLKHYRVSMDRTMEYIVLVPSSPVDPFPKPVWGWQAYKQSGVFPIYGPALYGEDGKLGNRKLLFLPNTLSSDVMSENKFMVGWIIDMSLFGMNEKAYEFYKTINDQLEADGKLFDPVYAQLVPNISCVSNPKKKVVGYFEVSSYSYKRFFVMSPRGSQITYFHYVENPKPIPLSGTIIDYFPPVFWETP